MSKIFNPRKAFDIDLTGRLKYGDIPVNLLYEVFKDGRITGLLVEHLLDCEHRNLTKASNPGEAFDLFDTTSRKVYECKSTQGESFSIAPSYMKGKGRKFNRGECEDRLLSVDGIILCCLTNFPLLEFATVMMPDDLDLVSITGSDAKVNARAWKKLRQRRG